MDFKTYYDNLERGERMKLAKELGVYLGSLSQMASGYTKIPPARALAIELATRGEVTRKELLPNDWEKYWLPSELDHTDVLRREVEQ
ncbi:transcriptional regulator [Buttiauxella sp. S19-1]|uniref:transcriptional regulator n=1 Tax=Buttiauxella sp. S19-1 TaxID=941430 RepID=UPI001EDB96BB|nr:YdaS family helix-turn-helix protein [Buttiauxella sp. S19-1]